MIQLNQDFYNDLAQELITQVCDKNCADGVVELKVTSPNCEQITEILFAFNNADYTLQNGLSSLNYLILAFSGGVRCSVDFNAEILEQMLAE